MPADQSEGGDRAMTRWQTFVTYLIITVFLVIVAAFLTWSLGQA